MAVTDNFDDYIRTKLAANSELAKAFEDEAISTHIAQQIFDLQKKAGLSQSKLAEMIGTQQSVISRIEDSDYEGHSVSLLKRIADALGVKVKVEFYSAEAEPLEAEELTAGSTTSSGKKMIVHLDEYPSGVRGSEV